MGIGGRNENAAGTVGGRDGEREGMSLQSRAVGCRGWGIRAEKVPPGNACALWST